MLPDRIPDVSTESNICNDPVSPDSCFLFFYVFTQCSVIFLQDFLVKIQSCHHWSNLLLESLDQEDPLLSSWSYQKVFFFYNSLNISLVEFSEYFLTLQNLLSILRQRRVAYIKVNEWVSQVIESIRFIVNIAMVPCHDLSCSRLSCSWRTTQPENPALSQNNNNNNRITSMYCYVCCISCVPCLSSTVYGPGGASMGSKSFIIASYSSLDILTN